MKEFEKSRSHISQQPEETNESGLRMSPPPFQLFASTGTQPPPPNNNSGQGVVQRFIDEDNEENGVEPVGVRGEYVQRNQAVYIQTTIGTYYVGPLATFLQGGQNNMLGNQGLPNNSLLDQNQSQQVSSQDQKPNPFDDLGNNGNVNIIDDMLGTLVNININELQDNDLQDNKLPNINDVQDNDVQNINDMNINDVQDDNAPNINDVNINSIPNINDVQQDNDVNGMPKLEEESVNNEDNDLDGESDDDIEIVLDNEKEVNPKDSVSYYAKKIEDKYDENFNFGNDDSSGSELGDDDDDLKNGRIDKDEYEKARREIKAKDIEAIATTGKPVSDDQKKGIDDLQQSRMKDYEQRKDLRGRYSEDTIRKLNARGQDMKKTSLYHNRYLRRATRLAIPNEDERKSSNSKKYETKQGAIRKKLLDVLKEDNKKMKWEEKDFSSPEIWKMVQWMMQNVWSNDAKKARLHEKLDNPQEVTSRSAFHHLFWKESLGGRASKYALNPMNLTLRHDEREVGTTKAKTKDPKDIRKPGQHEYDHQTNGYKKDDKWAGNRKMGGGHFSDIDTEAVYHTIKPIMEKRESKVELAKRLVNKRKRKNNDGKQGNDSRKKARTESQSQDINDPNVDLGLSLDPHLAPDPNFKFDLSSDSPKDFGFGFDSEFNNELNFSFDFDSGFGNNLNFGDLFNSSFEPDNNPEVNSNPFESQNDVNINSNNGFNSNPFESGNDVNINSDNGFDFSQFDFDNDVEMNSELNILDFNPEVNINSDVNPDLNINFDPLMDSNVEPNINSGFGGIDQENNNPDFDNNDPNTDFTHFEDGFYDIDEEFGDFDQNFIFGNNNDYNPFLNNNVDSNNIDSNFQPDNNINSNPFLSLGNNNSNPFMNNNMDSNDINSNPFLSLGNNNSNPFMNNNMDSNDVNSNPFLSLGNNSNPFLGNNMNSSNNINSNFDLPFGNNINSNFQPDDNNNIDFGNNINSDRRFSFGSNLDSNFGTNLNQVPNLDPIPIDNSIFDDDFVNNSQNINQNNSLLDNNIWFLNNNNIELNLPNDKKKEEQGSKIGQNPSPTDFENLKEENNDEVCLQPEIFDLRQEMLMAQYMAMQQEHWRVMGQQRNLTINGTDLDQNIVGLGSMEQFQRECGQMAAFNAYLMNSMGNESMENVLGNPGYLQAFMQNATDQGALNQFGGFENNMNDTDIIQMLAQIGAQNVAVIGDIGAMSTIMRLVNDRNFQGLINALGEQALVEYTPGIIAIQQFMRGESAHITVVVNTQAEKLLNQISQRQAHWIAVRIERDQNGTLQAYFMDSVDSLGTHDNVINGLRAMLQQ